MSPQTLAHVALGLGCLATLGSLLAAALYLRERRAHARTAAALDDAGALYRDAAKRVDVAEARAEAAEVQRASEAIALATRTAPPGPMLPDDARGETLAAVTSDPRVWGPVFFVPDCRCGRCTRPPWAPVVTISPRGPVPLAFVTRWAHA